MKKYYLTTPLYYVNDVPHIGHAYTTTAADVLARWQRLAGREVFFLTGTDEHGAKIEKAAADAGEEPQVFVNRIAGAYKDMWQALQITHDDFIQTSEPRHKKVVQAVFEKLKASGDIYKGTYEDWYCMSDESYFSESELVNKKCPSCGRDVVKLKEESYFFKLSKYEQPLLNYYTAHPEFLAPPHRANEIINFVKSGLRDLSVSRTRVKWGVPVSSDPGHTVYVWFDALLNYITAAGWDGEKTTLEFTSRWPADVHLVGKEIFRFHTVIWPAMLMALKIPLPRQVFAHGWWTVEGQKMSKSLGNVVNPKKMADEYGVDAFRYFLLREVPFGSDGDFSEKALLGRYNAELANSIGNLLQRTLTLIQKNFDGVVPSPIGPLTLVEGVGGLTRELEKLMEELKFGEVLETILKLVTRTNQYIDTQAPWKLGPDQKETLAQILVECLSVLKVLAVVMHPFMPAKTREIWDRLGETGSFEKEAPVLFGQFRQDKKPVFAKGQQTKSGDPLFLRKGTPKK